MLRYSVPPRSQRQQPVRRPKLGPWLGIIDTILEEDKFLPVKQRHTAKRIFERLKAEYGFSGGCTIVKDYVHREKRHGREMSIPLTRAPGEGQADFGEALVVVADDSFVMAFPGETTEAFLEGHVRVFVYFGGVPPRILYDNAKIAVARILGDGTRQKTRTFSELQSNYLFAKHFCRDEEAVLAALQQPGETAELKGMLTD